MATPTPTSTESTLRVSEEVRAKFPDLVALIERSQSMNEEERQYWVDVLLIMTDDQVQNLKNILENEKRQIEAANQSLQKGVAEEESKVRIVFDALKYREKKRALQEEEKQSETEEARNEAALLQEIQKM